MLKDDTRFSRCNPKTKTLRFRFSLGSLLVLLTVFCIWLGWHVPRSRKQSSAAEEIRELGGTVFYSYQVGNNGGFDPNLSPRIPRFLWGWIGEDFIWPVVGLDLRGDEITNEDLLCLSGFESVTDLYLHCSSLSDEAMPQVAQLGSLENLSLVGTKVTDSGVATLQSLKNLGFLSLAHTPVDDACIVEIAKFESLYQVMLEGTAVTQTGVDRLRQLRPRLSYYLSEEDTQRRRQALGN